MLDGELVVRANDGAFQEAPDALYGVGVDVPHDPLFLPMIDGGVQRVVVLDALVRFPIVREDRLHLVVYVLFDEGAQLFAAAIPDHSHADLRAALDGSDHEGIATVVASSLAALLAADPGFVLAASARRSVLPWS